MKRTLYFTLTVVALVLIGIVWFTQKKASVYDQSLSATSSNEGITVTVPKQTTPDTTSNTHIFEPSSQNNTTNNDFLFTPPTNTTNQPIETTPQANPSSNTSTTETPNQKALHIYANVTASALIELYNNTLYSVSVFKKLATSTPPQEVVPELRSLATIHAHVAQTLTLITPPTSMATLHNTLITERQAIADILNKTATTLSQGGNIGVLKDYSIYVTASANALIGIAHVLRTNNVSISPSESGFFFIQLLRQ